MAKKKVVDPRAAALKEVAAEVDRELGVPAELTPERIALAYARHFTENEDARIVLEDLKAKFNGSCVNVRAARGIDPYETHYREGQRDLYLHLVEMKSPPPKPPKEGE